MGDETKGAFSCTSREVKVARVVASTTVVDMDYSRVEVEIDGDLFEFSGPDAQVLGAQINTAGGGEFYKTAGERQTIGRAYRALANIDTGAASTAAPRTGDARWINEAREILRATVESYGEQTSKSGTPGSPFGV